MTTMYDVCKATGLSSATVSRVINDSDKVSEKTRKRVVSSMKKLDYHPNTAARMLASKQTGTIGVVLPEIDNGYYVRVLQGINKAVMEADLHLLVTFYENTGSMRKAMATMSASKRTDALMLINNSLPVDEIASMTRNASPSVLIGNRTESSHSFDIVGIDNVNGSRMAIEHFLDAGCQHLVMITGPNQDLDSIQREEGVQLAYKKRGSGCSKVRKFKGFFTYEGGKQAMLDCLAEDPVPPDAVFAFNDKMALGAMSALAEHGATVPGDVMVIGFDDSEVASYANLSSIHVPMFNIGYEAAQTAIRRITQTSSSWHATSSVLTTSLILRKTTPPYRVSPS